VISITNGNWIADLGSMICRNIENGMVVGFYKNGEVLEGKIQDIPMEIMEKWAIERHGENRIKAAVMEAEEVFMRAYFESKIEQGHDLNTEGRAGCN
jgi:hypothetical protein